MINCHRVQKDNRREDVDQPYQDQRSLGHREEKNVGARTAVTGSQHDWYYGSGMLLFSAIRKGIPMPSGRTIFCLIEKLYSRQIKPVIDEIVTVVTRTPPRSNKNQNASHVPYPRFRLGTNP